MKTVILSFGSSKFDVLNQKGSIRLLNTEDWTILHFDSLELKKFKLRKTRTVVFDKLGV